MGGFQLFENSLAIGALKLRRLRFNPVKLVGSEHNLDEFEKNLSVFKSWPTQTTAGTA